MSAHPGPGRKTKMAPAPDGRAHPGAGITSLPGIFPSGNQAKAYFRADWEAHWKAYSPKQGIPVRPAVPTP